MNPWHDLSTGDDAPETINTFVEIPKGSRNKYEYDEDIGVLKLDRVLFSPLHYPGDYALIPQTLAEDDDPLDALVLVSHPTYPGTLIEARPLGMLEMTDDGEQDDKILCVPVDDVLQEDRQTLDDVHEAVRNEIAHFFKVYKQLEGKEIHVGEWHGIDTAKQKITESQQRYSEKFSS